MQEVIEKGWRGRETESSPQLGVKMASDNSWSTMGAHASCRIATQQTTYHPIMSSHARATHTTNVRKKQVQTPEAFKFTRLLCLPLGYFTRTNEFLNETMGMIGWKINFYFWHSTRWFGLTFNQNIFFHYIISVCKCKWSNQPNVTTLQRLIESNYVKVSCIQFRVLSPWYHIRSSYNQVKLNIFIIYYRLMI